MTGLGRNLAHLRNPDRHTALRALSTLQETISPQGVVFEREAVDCVPRILELALNGHTAIRPELLMYLGNVHRYALGTWRRIRNESAPEDQSQYDEMLTWEDRIAAGYGARFPSAVALLKRSADIRVRGAAAYLVSDFGSQKHELIPLMRHMFEEIESMALKVDIIEAVANLGITLEEEYEDRRSTIDWIEAKTGDISPVIRLGATISLLARVDQDSLARLEGAVASSTRQDRRAVMEAMWLSGRSFDWATTRRLV